MASGRPEGDDEEGTWAGGSDGARRRPGGARTSLESGPTSAVGTGRERGRLGPWLLEERLHEGRRSLVYRARERASGREAVLKLARGIRPDPSVLARLEHEHAVLARLAGAGSLRAELARVEGQVPVLVLEGLPAISSSIRTDDLLPRLVATAGEVAGAERGALVVEQGGAWRVAAQLEGGSATRVAALPLGEAQDLSVAVVQYAIRTREPVLLRDAAREGPFQHDAYIRQGRVRSLLCLPVVHRGSVVASLYLENNLTSHAFTAHSASILSMLAAQAAISLENARAYDVLEERVRERTRVLEETLSDLRRTQAQMVESEKMASRGLLTAGVAHEIHNPVNFVLSGVTPLRRDVEEVLALLARLTAAAEAEAWPGALALVREAVREAEADVPRGEIEELLGGIDDGARRTAEIVRGLRSFSRSDAGDFERVNPVDGLESTLTLLRKQYHPRIRIVREMGDVPEIECHPGQLNQVFMNLLTNAVQAIEGEGEVRIRVERAGDDVRIAISDSGRGMSQEVLGPVFEPFFTTKPVGVGTGLGLSITFRIIERHHGRIEAESPPGEGTTFTLTLPIRQPAEREVTAADV